MAADAPTPKAQAADKKNPRWSAFINAQLEERRWTPTDFWRRIDRPSINRSQISHWKDGSTGASPQAATRVAVVLGLPASLVLREAGHDDIADYIEDVTKGASSGSAALEGVVAEARNLTRGLAQHDRQALEQDLITRIGELFDLTALKAERLRKTDGKGSQGSERDAS